MADLPNIRYIHSHDTGKYVQPYGFQVPTPNIQLLADQGVLFHQAFCAAPTCSGSRASLLTGQYCHNNGMLGQILWEQIALGFPEFGVRWNQAFNFAPWADACGGHGFTVGDVTDLQPALAAAFATDGPALVDVQTNADEPPMPAKVRYDQAKGFAEAFLRGQPNRLTIASTLFRDKWSQLVGDGRK